MIVMKKMSGPDKLVLTGKLMRIVGSLGVAAFLCQGIFLITRQGDAEWKLLVLGGIVVLSFALLVVGDILVRIGTRKGIEAQIRRKSAEK